MFWDYSPSQSHDSTKARTVELCPPSHLGNRRFFPAIKCCRFNDDQTMVFLLGFLGLRRPSVSMPWPHFGDQFVAKNWTFSQGGHGGESHGATLRLASWCWSSGDPAGDPAVESSPEPEISRRGMGDFSFGVWATLPSLFRTLVVGLLCRDHWLPANPAAQLWSTWCLAHHAQCETMLHQVAIWSSLTLPWTPMSHTRSWRSCWNTRCRCKTFHLILGRERTWWKLLRTVKGRSLCVIPMATTWSFTTATSPRPFASSRRMHRRRSQGM